MLLGYRLAWERAGVLHRDISLGNILIMYELEEEGHSGVIHDFDHSATTDLPPSRRQDESPARTDTDIPFSDGMRLTWWEHVVSGRTICAHGFLAC